ncbi:hypothetical protein A2824_01905 [Candidatus Nomurabacteria bacterium RIFCSPHIGHO2_01_FULL_42_16]|uniref:Uncharacterized protein n=1 Tax=Candidatus Nomurabacteria bacterium RIFCSPHIGHO2_01_FULL_42_16 TaxID=1801743 RepID=A0A1F6VHT9_9BACT|nr:MAG: hypothetical protein A2824_01905 [Candidatus Nomurabacteria bacterium RIFCSPHIGHO2_01_FULL_42_16]
MSDLQKDMVYFAKTDFRKTEKTFGIKRADRRQHMYVIGKTGTGKSVLLRNLILQDIANGEGVCVVDPHGELVESILAGIPDHRVKDVVYFNPADADFPIGFNVMEMPDPKYKHLVASGLMAIFTKIWSNVWSARMEYILNNAILALLDTPNTTLLGIPRILVDKDYRQKIINNVKDPIVRAFWVNEYEEWQDKFRSEAIAPIQNKVGQFLSTALIRNVVGQDRSSINIFDLMNNQKIFLINVSKGRIGEDNSALLGAMIITKVQLSAMERVRIPEDERKDFYLYVDEFQNFATDSFAGVLSEARKYRLNLIIAHQYIGQLVTDVSTKVRDAVFGNAGTMIMFRVGAADAEFMEKELSPVFMAPDMVNMPNYMIYIKLMIDGMTSRPFSAKTLPPLPPPSIPVSSEKVIEVSRKVYSRSRKEVEDAIKRWSGMSGGMEAPSEEGRETEAVIGAKVQMYPAVCANCGTSTKVPFKPDPRRPAYCLDCLNKIKAGEIKQPARFRQSVQAMAGEPTGFSGTGVTALAELGIEFKGEKKKIPPLKRFTPETKPGGPARHVSRSDSGGPARQRPQAPAGGTGPSSKLKNLLIKLEASEGEGNEPRPEAVSLDVLKQPPGKTRPKTKEASEENKAKLKDLLNKVVAGREQK